MKRACSSAAAAADLHSVSTRLSIHVWRNLLGLPVHKMLTRRGRCATRCAVLHSERANAHLRAHNYDDCLQDCAVAIYAEDDCKNAFLHKTSALHALERHEECAHSASRLRCLLLERNQTCRLLVLPSLRSFKSSDLWRVVRVWLLHDG